MPLLVSMFFSSSLAFTLILPVDTAYLLPDDIPYNIALWPGTHNSAINLGSGSILRPPEAVGGKYPSEASRSYQYLVMDQRLSVRDQLEQGIRVIDLEIARVEEQWVCNSSAQRSNLKDDHAIALRQQINDVVNWQGTGGALSNTTGYNPSDMQKDFVALQKLVSGHQRHINQHAPTKSDSLPNTECNGRCQLHVHHAVEKCFSCCPFVVSHGTLEQSVGAGLGYTFPEDLFEPIADFIRDNPNEIVTLYLISSHGNHPPSHDAILDRLNTSGLLKYVWNPDPAASMTQFPTVGEMRSRKRTVMIVGQWGPHAEGSHVNSSDISGADETCVNSTPCMEGWDSVSFFQLDPSRAILSSPPANKSVFFIENLSSRRGRSEHSAKYFPLPNLLHDIPFLAGGNPAQAAQAADYHHILELERRWASILQPFGVLPNWILVDFFNTTTATGHPSRALLPNVEEGLIHAVSDINRARVQRWYSGSLFKLEVTLVV